MLTDSEQLEAELAAVRADTQAEISHAAQQEAAARRERMQADEAAETAIRAAEDATQRANDTAEREREADARARDAQARAGQHRRDVPGGAPQAARRACRQGYAELRANAR